jgi:glycogen synthase
LSVLIHTPEPTSSPALYVDALVEALTGAGSEVMVVCPADHDSLDRFRENPLAKVKLSRARRIDTQVGIAGKVWRNGSFIVSSCVALMSAARSGDIVNFQYVMHLPFSALFFVCAKLRGCRIVFTAHDPLPHKWLLYPKLRWLERAALGWMYRICDAVLVHSEAGRKAILSNFRVAECKVKVIVHGPYKLSAALPASEQSETLDLLLFGALRENKGAHLAIQAIQQLFREGVRVRLTIAGRVLNRKEQHYWDECRKLIDRCSEPIRLEERFIRDDELPALFAAHDCFVLPYANFHSDSGVAFMALSNGRPFLSTVAGGLGHMIEASHAGIRIESPSVDDVIAGVRKAVVLGPKRLREMGVAGEAWVMQECGWPKVASQMRAIFAEVAPEQDGISAPAIQA